MFMFYGFMRYDGDCIVTSCGVCVKSAELNSISRLNELADVYDAFKDGSVKSDDMLKCNTKQCIDRGVVSAPVHG